MEQRPLRVGDNVDDYCPRERRITNHVIVALVGSAIRQTRCSACEAEHVFKAGHQPRPRKKDEPLGVLVHAHGAGGPNGHVVPAPTDTPVPVAASHRDEPRQTEAASEAPEPQGDNPGNELWSGHRRLIRATLPKVEGNEPPPRAIPEFTMHQRNVRGAHAFRQGQPWHDRGNDGMRGGRHGSPFGGGHGHGGGRGHFGSNGNGAGNGNGNGSGSDNIGNGAGPGGPGAGNRPGGGRRRRRRGRKPGPGGTPQ